jgi:predicted metal-binding membrane protein
MNRNAPEPAAPPTRAAPPRPHAGTVLVLVISAIAWTVLVWGAVDMGHPLAQLTMPHSSAWTGANLIAIVVMWSVMMAAMMLPTSLPMLRSFVQISLRQAQHGRVAGFITGYLLVWSGFSLAATAAQWLAQSFGWVDMMIVSASAGFSALLLLVAGAYQFTPLKRACLGRCRSPVAFLLGEWRAGARGAFVMGLRHGLFCLGCCWALMALLFVGGAMNLPWIVALSLGVAFEKLAPAGERIARVLGLLLIAAGAWRTVALALA